MVDGNADETGSKGCESVDTGRSASAAVNRRKIIDLCAESRVRFHRTSDLAWLFCPTRHHNLSVNDFPLLHEQKGEKHEHFD